MKPTQAEYEKRERKKCREKKAFDSFGFALEFAGALFVVQKKSLKFTNAHGAGNFI